MSLQQPHAGNHADVTDLALELAAARPPVHSASLVLPALSPGSVPRASPLHHRPDAPAAPPRHTARTGAGPSPRFIPDSVILHNCGHTGPKNGMESIHHSPGPGRHSSALSHFPAQARTAHTARPRTWISGPAITARDPDPARTARSGTQTSGPAHSAHAHHTPRLALPPAHSSSSGQKPQAPSPRLDRCMPRWGGSAAGAPRVAGQWYAL